MEDTKSPYMTVVEAADFLNVHANTVRNWITQKRLTAHTPKGLDTIRLLRAEVENFFVPKTEN